MSRPRFSAALLHPKHWGVWFLFGLLWLVVQMPQSVRMAFGSGVGKLAWNLKSRRHITEVNIRLAYPDLSAAEQEQLARDHLIAVGRGFIEMAMCWWLPEWRCRGLVEYQGKEHLETALKEGGVIMLSAHFTPLEFSGRLLALEHDIAAMFRPSENEVLNWAWSKFRGKVAKHAIPRDDVRGMIKRLKEGYPVWYAADQATAFKYTATVPFMGEPALTNTSTSRFAKLGKAKVVPFFVHRRADNKKYILKFGEALDNYPSDDDAADAIRMNQLIEKAIEDAPEQYFWLHRRYKNRDGLADPY
jgi:KDO2-lipid IV(A) lauroyltransferase